VDVHTPRNYINQFKLKREKRQKMGERENKRNRKREG
jgi:hypothetical protein